MSKLRIGVAGSSANPPHKGHLKLAEALLASGLFDLVIWIPCGVRPDKPELAAARHRRAMTDMTFAKLREDKRFIIRYDDIDADNTPTIDWFTTLARQYPGAEITWCTGIDVVLPRKEFGGKCEIVAEWDDGEKLMRDFPWLVVTRAGYTSLASLALPPNFRILDARLPEISSTRIRSLIARGDLRYKELATDEVAAYIETNKLYGWR